MGPANITGNREVNIKLGIQIVVNILCDYRAHRDKVELNEAMSSGASTPF